MGKLINGDDGLPAEEVGVWAKEKHEYLCRYIDIARGARAKYLGHGKGKGGATYIDLFCGPGRCRVRDTGEWIDGGAVAAWKKSRDGGAPFTQVFVGDLNTLLREAAANRLRQLGAPVVEVDGAAVQSVQEVVAKLNPYAQPHVLRTRTPREILGQPLGSLGEDLIGVLRRGLDDRKHSIEKLVRNILMEQVAHAVHEIHGRFPSLKRLTKSTLVNRELKLVLVPRSAHSVKTPRHHFSIAILAARRDLVATRRWVPRLLSPFNRRLCRHRDLHPNLMLNSPHETARVRSPVYR
jgi:hypothetical protein